MRPLNIIFGNCWSVIQRRGCTRFWGAYQGAWRDRKEQDVRFGKDEDQASLEGLAERMLAAFQASELAHPAGTIIGVEEELRGEIVPGLPDLLGRVDLRIDTGPELVVTDLKTSRSRWSADQAENSAEQLLLYGELARRLDPDKTVRLEFAVITKAKTPAVDRHAVQNSPRRLTRTLSIVRRIWAAIRSLNFYPAPSPMHCPTCPFRKPCSAWDGDLTRRAALRPRAIDELFPPASDRPRPKDAGGRRWATLAPLD